MIQTPLHPPLTPLRRLATDKAIAFAAFLAACAVLPPASPAEQTPAVKEEVKQVTEEELNQARANMIQPMPDPRADYVFGAAEAKSGWEGMPGMTVRKDHFGVNADGVTLDPGAEPGRAAYWRLEGITAGSYYVGLWVESGSAGLRTEYLPTALLTAAYLNGWPVRFATTTEPIQVQPGLWLLELQTVQPVELKPGDEIAFATLRPVDYRPCTAWRLALYRNEPRRGHGVTGRTFGVAELAVQRLRLVLQPEIVGTGEDGTEHTARITVANPLPYPVDADITWKLADYYGAPITGRTDRVRLSPHEQLTINHAFAASGDARAYQLDVKSRPAPDFKFPVSRPLEMLELSDYARWEFLPGQPDPLTVWNHTRKDLVDDRTGDRMLLCLNGSDWEWAYTEGRRAPQAVPTGLAFSDVSVPFAQHWVKLPPDRFGKWFRKQFVVPAWMTGSRYLLELSEVESEATIFLNGQRVGYGIGSLPIWADLTAALKPGTTNELLIAVRGGVSLMKPDFVEKYDPENWQSSLENEDIYANAYPPPCLRSVYLHTMPAVRVTQNLVLPDTGTRTLRIMTRVENAGPQPRRVTLRFQVFQNGKAVAAPLSRRGHGDGAPWLQGQVAEQLVTVTNGTIAEVSVEVPAGGLVPWTPRSPVLAKLVTTVVADGRVADTFERRFGYRDLRIQGTRMLLNGQRIRLFGICNGFRPYNLYEQDNGADFDRGDSEEYRDLYDEIGMPHLGTVWSCSAQGWPRLNNDHYWASWQHHVVESVWNKGSHPGYVGWNLSCEAFHYTIYTAGKEGQAKHGERLYAGAQAIWQHTWPHYWCMADGDESLGGRLNFSSFHYLNHGHAMGSFTHSPTGGFGNFDGVAAYAPDCFFLNGATQAPVNGTALRLNPDWIYGSTACASTEDFEFWGMHNGVPNSRFVGDRAAVSAAYQFFDPRGMGWTKTVIDGYRDMDQVLVGCVYWRSIHGLVEQDVAFSLPAEEIRYYSGARFDRRLNLFDDEYLPGKLDFKWSLLDPTGKTVRRGRIRAKSETVTLLRDRLAFDVPKVEARTSFTLNMELWKDGTKRAHEERLVEVWPRLAKATPGKPVPSGVGAHVPMRPRRMGTSGATTPEMPAESANMIVVFDPTNAVMPILTKFGASATPIAALDPAALRGAHVLIIGPDCVTPAMVNKAPAIRAFAEAGGRVLMLHQQDASLLPGDITIEKRGWFSMGYIRAPHHPVMQGLRDMDFHMWNPGHVIARGVFRKPEKGAFLTLVDSGHDGTMAWAEMLEVYLGHGSILATQMALTEDWETEPMAAELLKRLLAYLAQPVFRGDARPLAVVHGASEAILARLKEVRTDYAAVAGPMPAAPVTLLDLSAGAPSPGDAAAWRAYAEQGGALLVHRVRPEHQAWLEALTAKKVNIEVQPYQAWVDRQMLERRDGLLTGVNNLDLYWRSQLIGEGAQDNWQVSCGVEKGRERGQVQYVARVDGAADYLFPGGLVEVPLGRGRIIIDQLKWEMSSKDMVCGSPARVLSTLLTNLGVARKLPAPKPALPPGVTYEPIDLSAVVNRGFGDDQAGDGIGWLEWGSGADLRSFPTGRVSLAGVPYLIAGGDKNAIVLRMNPSWVTALVDYPDHVVIPVNKSGVAGLWFLHTGGWAGGEETFGMREIQYADGTKEVIRLNGSNMADWNPGHDDFPDEEVTTTTVAWKGACPQYPEIRVYHTLWVNPHPEKPIKQAVISNAGLDAKQWRFIPHLGLTAAIEGKRQAAGGKSEETRDADTSQRLLQEALVLLENKQTAEAADKLGVALQADDRNAGAWTALTGIRAETSSVEGFTALCGMWMQAVPGSYQPYNVLGQFLEKKGRLAEAVAAYKKSLDIDWNQPPTGEAVNRLEKKLK